MSGTRRAFNDAEMQNFSDEDDDFLFNDATSSQAGSVMDVLVGDSRVWIYKDDDSAVYSAAIIKPIGNKNYVFQGDGTKRQVWTRTQRSAALSKSVLVYEDDGSAVGDATVTVTEEGKRYVQQDGVQRQVCTRGQRNGTFSNELLVYQDNGAKVGNVTVTVTEEGKRYVQQGGVQRQVCTRSQRNRTLSNELLVYQDNGAKVGNATVTVTEEGKRYVQQGGVQRQVCTRKQRASALYTQTLVYQDDGAKVGNATVTVTEEGERYVQQGGVQRKVCTRGLYNYNRGKKNRMHRTRLAGNESLRAGTGNRTAPDVPLFDFSNNQGNPAVPDRNVYDQIRNRLAGCAGADGIIRLGDETGNSGRRTDETRNHIRPAVNAEQFSISHVMLPTNDTPFPIASQPAPAPINWFLSYNSAYPQPVPVANSSGYGNSNAGWTFHNSSGVPDQLLSSAPLQFAPASPAPSVPSQSTVARFLGASSRPVNSAAGRHGLLSSNSSFFSPEDHKNERFSEDTQNYLNILNAPDKQNMAELIFCFAPTHEEIKFFEPFVDPIMGTYMEIPVQLNEDFYDLQTILNFQGKNPYTRAHFTLASIQSARKLFDTLDEVIKKLSQERSLPQQRPESRC